MALLQDPHRSVEKPAVKAVLDKAKHDQSKDDGQKAYGRMKVTAANTCREQAETDCNVGNEADPTVRAGSGDPLQNL